MTLSTKKLKNSLYRRSPDYRAKAVERAKRRAERVKSDPIEARLIQLRKDHWNVRESLNARLKHVERLEQKLLAIVAEITELEKQRDLGKLRPD